MNQTFRNSTARPPRAGGSVATGVEGSVIAGRARNSSLMRPIDAAPRWTRLTAQPSAIIGQTSIARYTPKATNAPTVTVPAIISRPPTYSTMRPLSPPSRVSRG